MVLKKGFITRRKPKLKKLTSGGDSGAMRNLYSKIFCVWGSPSVVQPKTEDLSSVPRAQAKLEEDESRLYAVF